MAALVKLTSECLGVASPGSGQIGEAVRATASEVASGEAVQLSLDVAQRAVIELKIDASILYVITLGEGSILMNGFHFQGRKKA